MYEPWKLFAFNKQDAPDTDHRAQDIPRFDLLAAVAKAMGAGYDSIMVERITKHDGSG